CSLCQVVSSDSEVEIVEGVLWDMKLSETWSAKACQGKNQQDMRILWSLEVKKSESSISKD
ncbi:10384_t:CDS:2, partial [Gigaspora rosea]